MERDEFDDFTLSHVSCRTSYAPAPSKDTGSIELSVDVNDGKESSQGKAGDFSIPPKSEESRHSAHSAGFRTAQYKSHASVYDRVSRRCQTEKKGKDSAAPESEYSLPGPMLTYAEVRSWPNGYDFYGKFAADARESFERSQKLYLKKEDNAKVSPHTTYFAYIPQFKQLNPAQWDYYLHMKNSLFDGICLSDADLSYILLFIYELINVEELTGAADGAELLARIWMLYRRYHPELDKYMSEWMADYCIVYRTPLPEALIPVICDICSRSTVKEFYADAARAYDETHGTEYFPRIVRVCMADYSPCRSRYADKIEDFENKVGAVFDAALREDMISGKGLFDKSCQRDMKISRDVFCGSLCSSNIKKRITLTLCTFMRSPEQRRAVTEMLKGAENAVRARYGVKARLSAPKLRGQSAEISAVSEEERDYLKYYDSPSIPLTHEAAAQIEETSWKNTDILTDGEFGETPDENDGGSEALDEPAGAIISDGFDEVHEDTDLIDLQIDIGEDSDTAVDEAAACEENLMDVIEVRSAQLASAMRHVLDGGSFSEYCRKAGLFADSAASEINEAAYEIIGDVVLEMSCGDYRIIEEYREEIGL